MVLSTNSKIHLLIWLWLLNITIAQKTTIKPKIMKPNIRNLNQTISTIIPNSEVTTEDYLYTTTEEPFANCTSNDTCIPKLSNSTASQPHPTMPTKHYKLQIDTFRNQDFCTCDLQEGICDINCCCDKDCTNIDKFIFNHCDDENLHYDARYCKYTKYLYINNTPFQWDVNQNGLFCVIKSNLPTSYTIQPKQLLPSFTDAETHKLNKFSWSKYSKSKKSVFVNETDLRYGNHIWVFQKGGVKRFQLPHQFLSNICLIQDNVIILKNTVKSCSQIDISQDNEKLSMKTYFQNMFIFNGSHLINTTSLENNLMKDCPKNICVPIIPHICNNNFSNCNNVSQNDIRTTVKCNFNVIKNVNVCSNLVKELRYNFYHNGTKGFFKIDALTVLENITYEFEEYSTPHFIQKFSVNFWWTKDKENFSSSFSGNPGYIIGKPILTGKLAKFGNKSNPVLKIQRSFHDYTENFLTLPENVNEYCVLDNTTNIPIEFSYNLLTRCKIRNSIFITKNNSGNGKNNYLNGTNICQEIQKNIFKLWRVKENTTIGMFGNANANEPEEWINIIYNKNPEILLNETNGQLIIKDNILNCLRLVNSLQVSIYHSKVDFKNLFNQEKILEVTYEFDVSNQSFSYHKNSNIVNFEFKLESRVVFYDISLPKKKKSVDPPSLEIKLPYDFFILL